MLRSHSYKCFCNPRKKFIIVASNTVNVTSVIFAATPKQCEVKKTYIQIVVQRLLREVLEGSSSERALPTPPAFTFLLITFKGGHMLMPPLSRDKERSPLFLMLPFCQLPVRVLGVAHYHG
jgi:hypothetical protein